MSTFKSIAAVSAITVLTGVGAAAAATTTYDIERQSDTTLFSFETPVMTNIAMSGKATRTSQIGGYAVTATEQGTSDTWDFVGWCIDLFTNLKHGGYASKDIDTYRATMSAPSGLHAPERIEALESFFRTTYDASVLDNRVNAGGWQLAIWEILYETQTSGSERVYSLTSGALRGQEHTGRVTNRDGVVRSVSGSVERDTWAAANGYLDAWQAWEAGDPEMLGEFTYFSAVNSADEIDLRQNQSLVTFTPIPLPAPALLLIGGLAALGAMKRRRS